MLLGVTAYVAAALSAFIDPLGAFSTWSINLWLTAMAWLGIEAVQRRSDRSVFAGATMFACLAYVALSALNYYSPSSPLPHQKLIELMTRPNRPAWEEYELQSYDMKRVLAITNFAVAFGLVAGSLALWRYRRLERREQRGTSA